MPVAAKICGLSSPETIDCAVRHGAAHLGFVFFAPSPRNVSPATVMALAARVPDHVGRVGVFVDPNDETVDRAIAAAALTALQLHKVTPQRAATLKARTGLSIWSAVAVRTAADLAQAARFEGAADLILFDAQTPAGSALPGGMGVRFDWALLRGFAHRQPWALSGGLDADNLADAVRQTGATLVDVSSGVESAPGVKDMDKIAAFLKAASQP